ncbi:hypothetical protein B566_EDAN019210 [Ephemera danica]|nr:hypothetical protein B566_EDAN019210 [Ephemera danica]
MTQHIAAGKVTPLAIADARRSSLAPNIPTLVEQAWNGFFAPKGTPAEVVRLLNGHMNDILKQPDVVERLATFGALPVGGAPEVLGRTNAAEYESMSKLIKELNITAQ